MCCSAVSVGANTHSTLHTHTHTFLINFPARLLLSRRFMSTPGSTHELRMAVCPHLCTNIEGFAERFFWPLRHHLPPLKTLTAPFITTTNLVCSLASETGLATVKIH